MAVERIAGIVVSTNGITLFKASGSSQVLTADDWRTEGIIDAIMIPIAKQGFAEIDLDQFTRFKDLNDQLKETTALTVVEDGAGVAVKIDDQVLTGEVAEAIMPHIERAAGDGQFKGVELFLKRLASIPRKHSADDLIKFLKRADMPIADDGSILAYKVLNRGDAPGRFKDKHSGKISQGVGSIVEVPEDRVNPNRNVECSYGLHIAAQSYINGFIGSSDGVFLVRIAPEDVIAVPSYDTSKMRVMRYEILAQLSTSVAGIIAFTKTADVKDEAFQALIAKAMADDMPPAKEIVHQGADDKVVVTPVAANGNTRKTVKSKKDAPLKRNLKVAIGDNGKKAGKKIETKAVKKKLSDVREAIDLSKAKPDMGAAINAAIAAPSKAALTNVLDIAKSKREQEYEAKLAEALKLYVDGGESIRSIAKKLGMDREALSKNLKAKTGA